MWKWKEEGKPAAPSAAQSTTPPPTSIPDRPVKSSGADVRADTGRRALSAQIGKCVIIKGEVSGQEDLYIDGDVQGTIELRGHTLTVGPNGRVRASVDARNVVICGRVDGNLRAVDRIELKETAAVVGDIVTHRLAIEDGAFLKGGIETVKDTPGETKVEPKPEKREGAPAMPMAAAAAPHQEPVLETVKK